jgi:hypothetical protein
MKKIVFLLTAILISVISNGQGIDFSGSWKLNSTKSKLNAEFSFAPNSIIIVQKGNELKVEKHSNFQGEEFTTTDNLTLDGKEAINVGFRDTQKKSVANWADDKASLKVISKLSIGDGGEMTITEVYKLIDGNLVIESNSSSSFGEMAETMVYDKN